MDSTAWYATREQVKHALDSKATARDDQRIDTAIAAASRGIEGLCHRRFYPVVASRSWDWPNAQGAAAWRLWLDDSELIDLTSITSGGRPIDTTTVLLEPNRTGPPYNRIELNLGDSAAFGGGPTTQRDITITGLWGYRDDESPAGTAATGAGSTATSLTVTDAASVGVGTVLRAGTERLIVTGRRMADTGQSLQADLATAASAVTVQVADGSGYQVGEVLLVDGERMLIVDIAANTLVVKRAWDGSVLAAHTTGATIHAPRTLTVTRGALGTAAAGITAGDPLVRWDPPPLVNELCVAEALVIVLQGSAGWARTAGTGEAQREVTGRGLAQLRDQMYTVHGRHLRHRSV